MKLAAISFLCLWCSISFGQSYGLQFNSHEALAENRTSLDLSPNGFINLEGNFQLNFGFKFLPGYNVYFGYMLRILDGNQHVDLLFDQQKFRFQFIQGHTFLGSFSLDSNQLYNQWNNIVLTFNVERSNLTLTVNGKQAGSCSFRPETHLFKFFWGANDYGRYETRDIPPMAIRDIKLIENGKTTHNWPLNELAGKFCRDLSGNTNGEVKNPVWIKPRHQQWRAAGSLTVSGNALVAFDARRDRLFVAGSDTIYVYNFTNHQRTVTTYPIAHQPFPVGITALYDTITDRLCVLEADNKRAYFYRVGDPAWTALADEKTLTEFWHANKFLSPVDTSIYIAGGYGQLKYKNSILKCNLGSGRWDSIKTKGDFFPPRYLGSLGLNSAGDTAYLIGGYGSASGSQMLDPGNYTDVFSYSIRSRSFTKLFNLDTVIANYAFASSLIIDSRKRQYYGLVFPNDSFNTSLKLITGSLEKPEYELVASAIPYSFYDIQSYADLFFSRRSQQLITVTLFHSKYESPVKNTAVQIFSIDFPPESLVTTPQVKNPLPVAKLLLMVLAVVSAGVLVFFYRKRKREATLVLSKEEATVTEPNAVVDEINKIKILPEEPVEIKEYQHQEEMEPVMPRSSIFLFGQFQVFDASGQEITELFTPLIKEVFLFIVIYSVNTGRGVTSQKLNETFWHDKLPKDAKNNRSVNIAKLKKILERVGNCNLVKKSNFWVFELPEDDSVYLDYLHYSQLLNNKTTNEEHCVKGLLELTQKGPFLMHTEYQWLDDVKADISGKVIDICIKMLKRSDPHTCDPEFIIGITNCIFRFDALNEDALEYKCNALMQLKRHALANQIYLRFVKEYRQIYGEEFDRSYVDVVKSNPYNDIKIS